MKRFSSVEDRRRVFAQNASAFRAIQEADDNAWVNLYELLDVPENASEFDLDEAIIDRGADVVLFAFARGKPAEISRLEKHLREMRPVLLDAPTRRRYDQLLARHRARDASAPGYQEFLQSLDLREYSGCLTALPFLLAPLGWLLWQHVKIF